MKKIHLLLLSVTLCVFSACHNDIWDAIDGLDSRVTKLEELCKEMNTNISALQTIVDVLQSNDFITGIVEIKKNGEVIGYTITFGKHDPITIYHGKDGQNGADGKDGITPVIGIAQDTDGVYYWTLNGEWLLDDNGNKLSVSGKDGQNGTNGSNGQDGADGKDGQDGEDGADGQDGKDGITPQLKIEEGYWYISYDNGATWTQLDKATGEDGKDGADGKDGQNGANGKDGQDGDSMFQSVTQDENYVYFTLADGTVIKIAKGNGNNQSNDDFIFTITYDANGGEGVMERDTFYYGYAGNVDTCTFKREGYYFSGEWNTNPNGTGASYKEGYSLSIDKNITLYAQWSMYEGIDLGLSVKWAKVNIGAKLPEDCGYYFAWGETAPKDYYSDYNYIVTQYNSTDQKIFLDLVDDAAAENWGGNWRMPTDAEIKELRENCTWTWTDKNGINGYIVTGSNGNNIFLPTTGSGSGGSKQYGFYWSNSLESIGADRAFILLFHSYSVETALRSREMGFCIRPVCL